MPGYAPRLLSREWGEFQPPPPQDDDRITRVRKLEGPHLDAYRDLTGPLLLPDKEPETYDRAAARWHVRSVYDSKNVDLRESLAALALLAAIPANRLAATALAELLGRPRGLERAGEVLVGCARVT